MRNLTILFLSIIFLGCSSSEEVIFTLPTNAVLLLTSDSTKTWKLARRFNNKTRMNMGDCFLSYRQTFRKNMTMQDNNGEQRDCGKTLKANWIFSKDKKGNPYLKLTSELIPELLNIEEKSKYFKLIHLAEDELILQFQHKQFGNKRTTITDIYVPENSPVEDREFHW